MEFNKEIFEKALKANKIVKYQTFFEAVVKSYLEIENQALRIHDVVGQSEQLCDFLEWYDESLSYEDREMYVKTYIDMKSYNQLITKLNK